MGKKADMITVEWLVQENWRKQHAVPADRKRYGDYSMCGKGGGGAWRKAGGGLPRCGKCLSLLGDLEKRTKRVSGGIKRWSRWDVEKG